jgi:hypothetical protein
MEKTLLALFATRPDIMLPLSNILTQTRVFYNTFRKNNYKNCKFFWIFFGEIGGIIGSWRLTFDLFQGILKY